MKPISILVLTTSPFLNAGIRNMISSVGAKCDIVSSIEFLERKLSHNTPDLAIIDPLLADKSTVDIIKHYCPVVGLAITQLPEITESLFDATIGIYDGDSKWKSLLANAKKDRDNSDEGHDLTPREVEVVRGIVKGLSNKQIASDLNVSVNTVTTHRRNIAAKLDIHSAAGLTIYAIVKKIVSLDEISSSDLL